jgi:endonuclease-3 related protein
MTIRERLAQFYGRMSAHYGPTHWWPGDSPFEIAIGAILTQNTAWTNVEKAIENLKRAGLLDVRAMLAAPEEALETALRPSGYFRQKTQKVKRFCAHLIAHYDGRMDRMARRPLDELRKELLGLKGIGPETADDILLYACDKTVFVVDAYTHRIFSRHGFIPAKIGYEDLRAFFEGNLEPDGHTFKEYHGLIVWVGKDFCRKQPRCAECPLGPLLRRGEPKL